LGSGDFELGSSSTFFACFVSPGAGVVEGPPRPWGGNSRQAAISASSISARVRPAIAPVSSRRVTGGTAAFG
jgi:hypothetical protein